MLPTFIISIQQCGRTNFQEEKWKQQIKANHKLSKKLFRVPDKT